MSVIKARVVSERTSGSRVILASPISPAITGDGGIDIICGICGTTLIRRARPNLALHNILIRCPRCHQCNDTEEMIVNSTRY